MKLQALFFLMLLTLIISSCRMTTQDPSIIAKSTTVETLLSSPPEFYASALESRQNLPFSEAVKVGNTFYLSGQIGRDLATGLLAEGGIEAETRQTLENIKAVLNYHDMDMSNVVKALVILDDIEDFSAFNAIYVKYLPQKPARTTFAAEALAAGAKIEIEVVAVKGE